MSPKPNLKPLERISLSNSTADYLREAIIDGSLPLGQRLLEVDISRQLDISRGTLREALQILENEGLVESSTGRGRYVMSLSERNIREIYSLRSILEQEAVRLASQNIDQDGLSTLRAILETMFNAARKQDVREAIESDFSFHQEIWRIADNHLLQQVLHSIALKARVYLAIQTKQYADLVDGLVDHEKILAAIQDQDAELTAMLMREHMAEASRDVLNYARKNR